MYAARGYYPRYTIFGVKVDTLKLAVLALCQGTLLRGPRPCLSCCCAGPCCAIQDRSTQGKSCRRGRQHPCAVLWVEGRAVDRLGVALCLLAPADQRLLAHLLLRRAVLAPPARPAPGLRRTGLRGLLLMQEMGSGSTKQFDSHSWWFD